MLLKVHLVEFCGRSGVPSAYFGSIDSKTFISDLKFTSGIAKRHKGKNPDKNANSAGRDAFESADVDSLTVITKPVTKVDAL
jgi:hypothetical protein